MNENKIIQTEERNGRPNPDENSPVKENKLQNVTGGQESEPVPPEKDKTGNETGTVDPVTRITKATFYKVPL